MSRKKIEEEEMNAQINIYLKPMDGSLNSGDSCYKYFALVCFKFVKYLDLKKKKKNVIVHMKKLPSILCTQTFCISFP